MTPERHHTREPSMALLHRHDALGSFARVWQTSYASDYVGLMILIAAYFLVHAFIEPFHRMFTLDNVAIQFPHAEVERVPVCKRPVESVLSAAMLFVYGLIVPMVALFVWAVVLQPAVHKVHVTYLGLVTSVFLTTLITEIVKNGVGRPRPDLIDRCKPVSVQLFELRIQANGTPLHELVTFNVCTQTDHHTLHDGFRSFPSGHSSFSFSGLGFLTFFIAGQTRILHPYSTLPALLLAILPAFGALMIAVSRCEDYRHDVYDVTAGSFLGIFIAWLTYRRYYPNLRHASCEVPYPNPKDGLKLRHRDLESQPGGNGHESDGEQAPLHGRESA